MSLTKNVLDACTVVHVMLGLGVEEKKENSVPRLTGFTVQWERQAVSNYITVVQ